MTLAIESSFCRHLWTFKVIYSYLCRVEAPQHGVRRLEWFIRRRIAEQRITFTALAERAGLNRSTLYKAVRNSSGLRPSSLDQLDEALHWPAGTCAHILAGGDPPQDPPPGGEHTTIEARLRSIERQISALWDAVALIDPNIRMRNAC